MGRNFRKWNTAHDRLILNRLSAPDSHLPQLVGLRRGVGRPGTAETDCCSIVLEKSKYIKVNSNEITASLERHRMSRGTDDIYSCTTMYSSSLVSLSTEIPQIEITDWLFEPEVWRVHIHSLTLRRRT